MLAVLIAVLWTASACGAGPQVQRPVVKAPTAVPAVRFEPWTRASFERAAREGKQLLVSVQTRWCHWCHVMNDVTFRDPEVLRLLARHFVVIAVDADARPDVAERYARWGWPATGLLTADGSPLFANLNGQSIAAFAQLYAATFDPIYLKTAVAAYQAIERTHRKGEGYVHAAGSDDPRLYLADQLEMARGVLALHEVTGERAYLLRLRELLAFTASTFEDREQGGFFAHTPDPEAIGALALPRKPVAQNARLASVLLWMSRREGEPVWQLPAERALRAVGQRAANAREPSALAEYVLALEELLSPHVTITIVGRADDTRAQALLRAAFAAYAPNRRVRLAAPDESHYPYPGQPVAYMCSGDACSLPVADPDRLQSALDAAL